MEVGKAAEPPQGISEKPSLLHSTLLQTTVACVPRSPAVPCEPLTPGRGLEVPAEAVKHLHRTTLAILGDKVRSQLLQHREEKFSPSMCLQTRQEAFLVMGGVFLINRPITSEGHVHS